MTDPDDPACGPDVVVNQGSGPAVRPNDEVYVTWERGVFAPDGGRFDAAPDVTPDPTGIECSTASVAR